MSDSTVSTDPLPCLRCGRLVELTVTGDFAEASIDEPFEIGADGAIVTAICDDCVTPREARQAASRNAARFLLIAEEAKAELDGLAARHPGFRDHSDFKRRYADLEASIEGMRITLDALLELDDDD
jgi:hypothetical protein